MGYICLSKMLLELLKIQQRSLMEAKEQIQCAYQEVAQNMCLFAVARMDLRY